METVCDVESLECVVHHCENCPELEVHGEMICSQWGSTDHTALRNNTSSVNENIELPVYQLDKLTAHSL